MLLGDLKAAWGGKKVKFFFFPTNYLPFLVFCSFFASIFPCFGPPNLPTTIPKTHPKTPKKKGWVGGGGVSGPLRKNSGQILAKPGGLERFWEGVSRPKILDKFWKSTEFLSRKKFWKGPWGVCPEKKFCKNSVVLQNFCPEKNL